MNIKITNESSGFRADCLDLTGSPPVGIGQTSEMALAHLFYIILNSDFSKGHILNDKIIVNGKKWKLPKAYLQE